MSGVYFKGIEMPKSCRDCWLKMNCDECEGWECVCVPLHTSIGYFDDLLTDKRREDCPIIPVPDHGDLIDKRDVQKLIYQGMPTKSLADAMSRLIFDAPTIIPADGKET